MRGLSLLCLLCAGVVQGEKMSPVQKVVQMIDEMAVKVQGDLDATSKNFEEFAKFCDDEATAHNYAIKDSNDKIEDLKAVIESSTAKISSFESAIQDGSGNIAGQQEDLDKSEQLREKEHQQFLKNEQLYVAMVEDLSGAQKAFALMQMTPEQKSNVDIVVSSLQEVVEASYVTHADFEKVHAFLQAKADSEDSLTIKAKSEGNEATLAILKKLEDRSADTLSNTRKKEQESSHAHSMLKQGLESEIQSLNEELENSKAGKHASAEALAGAEKDLAVETKGLNEDQTALSDLKIECQTKATEFEEEHREGNAELVALGKAKEILTKKFSTLQVSALSHTRKGRNDGGEDSRAKALRRIQQLGKQYHSTALITLAYRASESPFAKVTAMIEDMIAKLMQEAAEEATQKAFCDKELGTSQKSKAEKEASLRKTNARIDKGSSEEAQLAEGIQVLSQEVADIDAGMAEATALRNQEKAEFLVVERDFKESEEACAAAMSVLRDYYESASFVEVSSKSGAQATGAAGIIGLLEVAESDFATLLAEARTIEQTAADEYDKMAQDSKMSKATKEVDIKGKRSQMKNLKTSIANYNEDKDGVSSELDAVLAYLDKLKPQCETKTESYAEVKAKREAEISGLKEALNILSGDAVALTQVKSQLRRGRA